MEKAFTVNLVSYASILKNYRISFREDDKCLTVGLADTKPGWLLMISCRTLDTVRLLDLVLPMLKKQAISFRLIKNQVQQYRLNSGSFGESEVGKVLSIFPISVEQAIAVSNEVILISENFKGPVVPNSLRIGEILYLQYVETFSGELKIKVPDLKKLPFAIPERFRTRKRKKSIVGKYYVPIQLIRSSPKGDILKAINLKRFAFDWCLIKEGKPVALDDHFDRDMRDRLLWQREVINALKSNVPTPGVVDYFEINDTCYLILNFVEGESFGHVVRGILNGTEWKKLEKSNKITLLENYLMVLEIVKSIHERNFVHRDITDSNFLVMADGSMCIIDFELSYSLLEQRPNPPFLLGTYGYAAPEQLQYAKPDIKEDIYSLGVLLSFTLSGCQPHEFLATTPQNIKAKLARLTGSTSLASTVNRCLQIKRNDRPEITEIKSAIIDYLENLKLETHEEVGMAV